MKTWFRAGELSARSMVLAVLGVVTLGVAVLSVAVSFGILEPAFGGWAVPTVFALDALWVVCQAAEILAGNNHRRAKRVRWAGLSLTAVNAAIPTAELLLREGGRVDLAVVITPVAIVATKLAWWVALPALGRKASPGTRDRIEAKRQEVADRLEEMEAEAAHRIELLEVAQDLEARVAEAETAYRQAVLKARQTTVQALHAQAEATEETVTTMPLPAAVTGIVLPVLGEWTPERPVLPGRAGSGTATVPDDTEWGGTVTGPPALGTGAPGTVTMGVTQVSTGPDGGPAHPGETGTDRVRDAVTDPGTESVTGVTLTEIAAVAGVPTPARGEYLNDAQLAVVLRHLRHREDPPLSYRQAMTAFRQAGFVGGEERIRRTWAELLSREEDSPSEHAGTPDEDPADAAEADEEDQEDEEEGAGPRP
ncbi:hypothetical protein ACWDR0_23815 [Streptomyces sp. NPDC003691]